MSKTTEATEATEATETTGTTRTIETVDSTGVSDATGAGVSGVSGVAGASGAAEGAVSPEGLEAGREGQAAHGADASEGAAQDAAAQGGAGTDEARETVPPPAPRGGWDDGLIARRAAGRSTLGALDAPEALDGLVPLPDATGAAAAVGGRPDGVDGLTGARDGSPAAPSGSALDGIEGVDGVDGSGAHTPIGSAYGGALRRRLDALGELVGLSRTRVEGAVLAEAGRVLDEASARQRLSSRHTVVAIAGATGSGKSTLFNALAGVPISETGLRRPTTSAPIACMWSDGAAGLLDRLAIPGRLRRRPLAGGDGDEELHGLVLVDLPDHDSAMVRHREQVDRVLALVDAVIWVVDPEKYADAALHERYLRPLAGHAEVTFVVLNQVDRLPGDAADQVLDDLRRLLDEDGMALGEHGEPGATVLALSALTGQGVGELRELLGHFVQDRSAAARRLSADVDGAALRLRSAYVAEGRAGLGERAREQFADRLAWAVGAVAAGEAAEREWRRNAGRACGTPWLRLWRWYESKRTPGCEPPQAPAVVEEEVTARQRVEQAVRTVVEEASAGLPAPWAHAVREAAVRGAEGLPEALDDLAVTAGPSGRPPRPAWWPAAVLAQAAMTVLQFFGALWLVGQIAGVLEPGLLPPVFVMLAGIIGGPFVEWACGAAAKGPARRYGQDAERRLREAAAGCGRARVLDPISAELMRYREVREQYVTVSRTGG
ncbi:GTPase [Streptomyces sp. NBC_01429]|uniref:GTPase n=1 Tax=Streptomyces sp. NBC_01429 TaxID=2903862 RepID=UPI002E2D6F18|nr:GTPase [Streptomyces sp. NBC_01429]